MRRGVVSLRLLSALVGELIAIVVLTRIAAPGRPSDLDVRSPLSTSDPIDVASGAARWLAIAVLSYLVIVTVLQLLAVALGAVGSTSGTGARLAALVARLGPRTVAGLAAAATVVSAASACGPNAGAPPRPLEPTRASVVMVLESAPGTPRPTPTVTMSLESDPTTTTSTTTAVTTTSPTEPTAPAATATTAPPAPPSGSAPSLDPTGLPDPADPTEPTASSQPGTSEPARRATSELRTVVVARGDSFWAIAEREVSARRGRPATDDETAQYWRLLIEVNRSRLVHAEDPDLIYAGQRFVLP